MLPRKSSKNECVLAVDDEADFLDMLKAALECYGFTVHTATTSKEALIVYRDHQNEIGMVLLDYLLPEMSGEWIFENLQCLNPEVKVVLLTGCEESVSNRMLKRGLRGFVQKPFSLPELVQSVRDAINSPALASIAS
jgi:two-component system, cell cycle sensor histidine kinase and response regulator CckA